MSEENAELSDAALASALSGDAAAPANDAGDDAEDTTGTEGADNGEQQAPEEAAPTPEPAPAAEEQPKEEVPPPPPPEQPAEVKEPEPKEDEIPPPQPAPPEVPPPPEPEPVEPPKPVTPPPPPPKPVVAPAPTPAAKAVDLEKPVEPVKAAPKVIVKTKLRASSATSDAIKNKVNTINSGISDDLHMHTPAGRQLIRMFDEYKEICAKARKDDEQSMIKAAYKLYDIMVICCPRNGNKNAAYYAELINIVFKKLTQGYGSLFKDSTLFRMDYRLPTPTESLKFDTFYTAMYQLVSYAKTGAPITFNNNAVGKVLASTSALNAIVSLRRRLEGK